MSAASSSILTQKLVNENLSFAKNLAKKFYNKRARSYLELSDIESAAYLGLCEAASRYDQSKENKFQTYSYMRIVGSMYDFLVSSGGYSRAHYKRFEGKAENDNYPTMRVARDLAELSRLKSVIEDWGIKVEINMKQGSIDLVYSDEVIAEEIIAQEQIRERIKKELKLLSPDIARIIIARYFEGKTVAEIALEFPDKSQSYVSRACSRGIEVLRENLKELA